MHSCNGSVCMSERKKILFVDDEASIRETLPAVLRWNGFEVVVGATVSDALHEIGSQRFDLLLSDLNIGEPGDGFTVVSAMRRTQPWAATIIITGYPAFESALRAIQSQVDDYIVKPADIPELLRTIRYKIDNPAVRQQPPILGLDEVLDDEKSSIMNAWLTETEPVPGTFNGTATLSQMPLLFDVLVATLRHGDTSNETALVHAAELGDIRRKQGYTVSMLVDELRVLERIVLLAVERNLIRIDLSTLFRQLRIMNEFFRMQLKEAVEAYMAGPMPPLHTAA
jgi:ActR/RegA family two-component response regulator